MIKNATLALVLIFLVLIVTGVFCVEPAKAQFQVDITLNADGSISPPSAPISKVGNTYTLTENIYGNIIVRNFNSVLDGAGYTLQGNGTGRGIEVANTYNSSQVNGYYVTIKNFNLKNYNEAICIFAYWGNILKGIEINTNSIINSNVGIRLSSYARYTNNTISNNIINGNRVGLQIEMAMEDNYGNLVDVNTVKENKFLNNQVGITFGWQYSYYPLSNGTLLMPTLIYYNDFIGNSKNAENGIMLFSPSANITWDKEISHLGNYWSDYKGIDSNKDGIGDNPYVIDSNNIDNYPLTYPINTFSFNYKPISSSLPIISPQPTNELASTPILPSPTVPEFSWLVILPLLTSIFVAALFLKHAKSRRLSENSYIKTDYFEGKLDERGKYE